MKKGPYSLAAPLFEARGSNRTLQDISIRFCGFGGQGIVLSAVIFGTTAVTKAGLNAVQMQSYGSEARGGECQAEVIVSAHPIDSPLADSMDVLVAMSQSALDKFFASLKEEGMLIIDPEFVDRPAGVKQAVFEVPSTRIATENGAKLAANMVMLGFLQQKKTLFSAEDLKAVIADTVPAAFRDVNLRAVESGMQWARQWT